jgi:hypothetical protein
MFVRSLCLFLTKGIMTASMKGGGKKLCRMKQLNNRAKCTADLAPPYMYASIEMPSGPGDLAVFCLLIAMFTSSTRIHWSLE